MPFPFPSYRARYLPAFTRAQILALPNKAQIPVIVPTGAIEQHGPQLPVAVDSFLGQVWVSHLCAALPAEVPMLVAPPITVGKSNEHVGFPGTLYVSKETLRQQLLTLATQLHAWGFRSFFILNTHGGNSAVIHYTLREITHRLGLRTGMIRHDYRPDISELEATYGFHANTVETALLYATAPQYTRPAAAPCHYPARLEDPGELRPEFAPATYAWASQDISPHGVMGDATAATLADGERWRDGMVDGLVRYVTSLAAEMAKP
jgi:creatinine amidohydrolase